jgi:hypothetical protein
MKITRRNQEKIVRNVVEPVNLAHLQKRDHPSDPLFSVLNKFEVRGMTRIGRLRPDPRRKPSCAMKRMSSGIEVW